MKKTIISIISLCCITAAFTSCGEVFNESSNSSSSVVEVTSTTKPAVTKTTTEVSTNKNNADVTSPVTEAATDKVKVIVTESSETPAKSLISEEKMNRYRNSDGAIYNDVNGHISANLTKDSDGYHLAIQNGTDYNPEYANVFLTFNEFGDVETSVFDNGETQFESDIFTIHGCLECLCLDAINQAGTRTYEYKLYPVGNFPDETSPNKNLTEFSSTLDNYNWKDRLFNQEMPDFFNDDQKRLFANAEYLMDNFELEAKFNSKQSYILRDNWRYFQTGESYESFVYYTESVFTPQLSAALLNQDKGFLNVRGEMCFTDGARGAHITYSSRSFNLISQNDKEIKFKLIAHNSFKGVITEDAYNNLPDEEKEFDKEYTFTMIKTLDGWRFSEFNYWL